MNRRELLASAGGLAIAGAASAMSGTAFADESHGGQTGHKHDSLIDSAIHCMKTAEICIKHCLDILSTGDKSLGECAKVVQELEAVCGVLFQTASYDSKYLKALAKIAIEVCADCEKECRKHDKHKSCLDCADACARCLKECNKLAA